MSAEKSKERFLETLKNRRPTAKEQGLHLAGARIKKSDWDALRKLFVDDGWSFQKFVTACVECYLARDPLLIKVINDWRDENPEVDMKSNPRMRNYILSRRDQNDLLDEIAEEDDE